MPLREELRTQGDFLFRHRSYLPIIIVFAGIYTYTQTAINSAQEATTKNTVEIIAFIVCLIGLLIRMIAVGYSASHTSGRNTTAGQIAETVNTTGLYATCRHPLYLGNFLMWLGIALFTQNFWFIVAFIMLFWLYYERIMYAEEEFLRQKYDQQYLQWAKQTPAFIPNIAKWQTPKHPFNLTKVIKQEKAGILNLFLVIFILKSIGTYFATGQWQLDNQFWLYGLIASIIYYIIIKILQKTTVI
jgi:protein-S-isoprenylcysteine O-methyltransferase Ste14